MIRKKTNNMFGHSDLISFLYSSAYRAKRKKNDKCPSCGNKIVLYKNKKRKYNSHCSKCPAQFKIDEKTKEIIIYKPNKSIKVKLKKSKKVKKEKIQVIDGKGNLLHEPGEFVCKCGPYIRGFYVARRIKDPVIPFGRIGVFRRTAQLMRSYPRRHLDPIC